MRRLSKLLPSRGYDICLIDSSPYHALKSRFHERVALTCEKESVRVPLRLLTIASKTRLLQDEILAVEFEKKYLAGRKGEYLYDYLVLALGGKAEYHGIKGAMQHSLHIYSIDSVERCSKAVGKLLCCNAGEPARIIVCGGGLTGIEAAAQLRDKADAGRLDITVVEAGDRLMPVVSLPAERDRVVKHLKRVKINSITGDPIVEIEQSVIHLASGKRLEADLILWCGGVRRSPLHGAGEGPRFIVNGFLQSEARSEVFSIGDFATLESGDRFANLASAQRAIYQGEVAAINIARLENSKPLCGVDYRPLGEVVALGDWDAAGEVKGFSVSGLPAAALKKAIEVRYLKDLFSDLPRAAGRALAYPFLKIIGG
jgi:NADH dehydrogenase